MVRLGSSGATRVGVMVSVTFVTSGTTNLVDLCPCRVASRCPAAVSVGFGGFFRIFCAVNPGTRMNPFDTAGRNVDNAGYPNAACQNATNSAAESSLTTKPAE